MATDGQPAGAAAPEPAALTGAPPATAPPPAVELLVHGVGGARPEEMLQDPATVRVTGDTTASIHRRVDDAADRPAPDGRPVREAYTWSNLTSGNGARALWLLLLPFMVVNVGHWMRPAAAEPHRAHRLYDAVVRLIALSLTALLLSGACVIALDLVAWQCASSRECGERASWLGPLAASEGWWAQPGRRLVVAAAVPALLTGLLWWLSRRTWSAYESASPPVRALPDKLSEPVLSRPGFWYGRRLVGRLRGAHTAAGLLIVAGALVTAVAAHDRGPEGDARLAALGWGLGALLGACWVAVVVLVVRAGRSEDHPDDQPMSPAASAVPWVALGLLVLAAGHALWSRPEWTPDGRHPGGAAFAVLTVVQGALVVALAVTARRLQRRVAPEDRGVLFGLGGAAVALLGCALGGVLTGGLAQRVADWLEPGSAAGEPGTAIAGPPTLLSWQAAAVPAVLCVVLVCAVVGVVSVRRRARRLTPTVRAGYPDESGAELPDRNRRIASAVAWAELTDSAPRLVGWITGSALALLVVIVAGSATGQSPAALTDSGPDPVAWTAERAQSLGSWLMGILVILLVAMGRRAYRDAGTRRTVGILWDVGTFWPRAAHPFAPPCYAERAVPDLSWRMGTWVDVTGGKLVISGHSQGSVLAAAAVWQLDAPTRSRVALLTYGSPLARLYGAWFPRYFGPSALAALHGELPRWRNLYRATDPIGGPVRVGPASGAAAAGPVGAGVDDAGADRMAADDEGADGAGADRAGVDRGPLPDPLYYGRNLRRPLPEPILGHGDYAADPAYARERAALLGQLTDTPVAVLPEQPGAAERPGAAPE